MSKKFLCIFFFIFAFISFASSQDSIPTPENTRVRDTTRMWNKGGLCGVLFAQAAYSNWSAGGENSLAATGLLNLYANYSKKKVQWDSYLDAAYGFLNSEQYELRKNDDRLEINSAFGYRSKETNWYYAILVNGQTQFDKGFFFPDDTTIVSDFMSPGQIKIAVGMDYKPGKHLKLLIAPVTGKSTIVLNPNVDELFYSLDSNQKWRNEYGAYVKFFFKKEVFKNITLQIKTDLFSNYAEDPQNIDISAQVFVNMNVNKYVSAGITLDMIYDDNISVPIFAKNADGDKEQIGEGPRLQLKEVFTLKIAAKF